MRQLPTSVRDSLRRDGQFASFSVWRILSVPLCVVLAGTLMACSPTEVVQRPIPSDFATYVAEGKVFSISYPQEWETPIYMIEPMKAALGALLRESSSLDLANAVEGANVVFVAGALTDAGHNPNVNVIAVASDNTRGSLNKLVDSCLRRFAESGHDVEELRRFDATIDGHDAIVVEYMATIPSFASSNHCVLMVMRAQKSMWFVTCTVMPPLDMASFEDELLPVLLSLRVADAA